MSQQPDNELEEVLDEIAQYLPDEMSSLNHNDLPEAKQRLLAWRDKAVIDELENTLLLQKSPDKNFKVYDDWLMEKLEVRLAQLKGGSNE